MELENQVLSVLLTGFKQAESGRILFLGKDLKEWLKDKRQKRDFL